MKGWLLFVHAPLKSAWFIGKPTRAKLTGNHLCRRVAPFSGCLRWKPNEALISGIQIIEQKAPRQMSRPFFFEAALVQCVSLRGTFVCSLAGEGVDG